MPTATSQAASPTTRRVILALGVVVVAIALYVAYTRFINPPPSHGGDPANDVPALAATKTFDYVGGEHTTDPVTYAQSPPAGGPHDPTWDDCGVYTAQPRNENVVHDLEHGTVWITYRPDLDQAGVQQLETALGTVKTGKTILSPYPDLSAPVVVTVWNAQLALDGPDDARLATFLDVYGDGHTAPEPLATCKGGAHVMASSDNP